MHTARNLPFLFRPHIQFLLLALACFTWGNFFASREAFITDWGTHWYWPHVYVYMIVVLIGEAIIYRLVSRLLCWPWLSHVHVASMYFFAVAMWTIEVSGDVPGVNMRPLSHALQCFSEYFLLAGHLAFFAHISIGVFVGAKSAA
ncbi:hypothetical protein [Chitinophaga rhizosphaerae]|uniref:hypothetical protein n=1 Tax=Chitinophaga rhizosphaerae TaxID=1864947 RepID=UPI000F80DC4F|nr:hypothetical protein [Chitinophaga rhizosphaerae]